MVRGGWLVGLPAAPPFWPMKNFKLSALGALLLVAAVSMAWHTLQSKPGLVATAPASERHDVHAATNHGSTHSVAHAQNHVGGAQADPAAQAAARQEIIQQLQEVAVTYDPAQLPVIQPYLVDADPALRSAAVNAMMVMGETSAAPMLRNAAKLLASSDEAKMYERKAAYLELPPIASEELASKIDPSASE